MSADSRWLSIDKADRTPVFQYRIRDDFFVNVSDTYWVRDSYGKIFEAAWTERAGVKSYWWNWDAEDVADPIEFMPHPFDERFQKERQEGKFYPGDWVRKKSGSWWAGRVVGFYSTEETHDGVCVQMDRPMGPIQIYPAAALELDIPGDGRIPEDDLATLIKKAQAKFDAMSPEEKAAHRAAQRESFVRGMTTPCEHGQLDFEQCPYCRGQAI